MTLALDTGLPLLALGGDRGIDVFRRADNAAQRRIRYECIATLPQTADAGTPASDERPALIEHLPRACRPAAPLWRAIEAYRASTVLHTPILLGNPPAYPAAAAPGERLTLMMGFDFLRARMVAEIAVEQFERKVKRDSAVVLGAVAETNSVLQLLLDFNMIGRGLPLVRELVAPLVQRVATPGFVDGGGQTLGYALRMAGDLLLRADDAALALVSFEGSVAAGDNPHRRRRAIAAAQAANDKQALQRHLHALAERGPLPDDLTAMDEASGGGLGNGNIAPETAP